MRKIYFFIALLIGLVSCSKQKSEVAQLLQDKISEVGANYGEVIIMETATGNIIEKICLDKDGKPYEDNFNRERLIEISEAVLNNEKSVYDIFGQDAIKVRSCILLFASVSDISVFKQLKSKYRW